MKKRSNVYSLAWAAYYAHSAGRTAQGLYSAIRRVQHGRGSKVDHGDIRRGIARLRHCAQAIADRTKGA